MKRAFISALLLVCTALAFAQQPAPAEEKDSKLLPPPMVTSFEGRPLYQLGGEEMKPPFVISQPDPVPLKDFRQATVVLWCIVGIDGKAHMITVAKRGETFEAVNKAMNNLKEWKFKPATKKKDDVDVLMTVEVVWR